MIVILPVLGLLFGQLAGVVFINFAFVLGLVVALAAVDAILLYFAVKLFQRETILTRWK